MMDRQGFQTEMNSREKLDFHLHKPLPRDQKKHVCVGDTK